MKWWGDELPEWMRSRMEKVDKERRKQEVKMVFVDVAPSPTVNEPPRETKYYSAHSSRASNPEIEVPSDIPQIDGTQERIVKTTEQPQPEPEPLQPAPENPEPSQLAQARPDGGLDPGDLQSLEASRKKPKEKPIPDPDANYVKEEEKQPQKRPRRLAEVQRPQDTLPGEKIKQEGGVRNQTDFSGLDVKGTEFGEYDQRIIEAIQSRWFSLLDNRGYTLDSGKVVLTFRLHADGRISEMRVTEYTVNEVLSMICQQAVNDPAPFDPWPRDMRRMIGTDYRDVKFTFFYN